jgi:hypothetical protein
MEEKCKLKSEKIWEIQKKGKLNSEKDTFQLTFLPYFPYHFTIFFNNFHTLSIFNLLFSVFSISFHYSTCLPKYSVTQLSHVKFVSRTNLCLQVLIGQFYTVLFHWCKRNAEEGIYFHIF